jgi:hypothetical protein
MVLQLNLLSAIIPVPLKVLPTAVKLTVLFLQTELTPVTWKKVAAWKLTVHPLNEQFVNICPEVDDMLKVQLVNVDDCN